MNNRDMYKYSESETLLRGARWAHEEEMKRILSKVCLSEKKRELPIRPSCYQ